jgi:hypothetical protein
MGTPLITSGSTAMAAIFKSEYDFLIADNLDEFEHQCLKLYTDKNLFVKMIENSRLRKDEHNNFQIVKCLLEAFKRLFL